MLFKDLALLDTLEHKDALTLAVEQEKSRGTHHAFVSSFLFTVSRVHLDVNKIDSACVTFLDLIHDGVHRLAELSSAEAEVLECRPAFDKA